MTPPAFFPSPTHNEFFEGARHSCLSPGTQHDALHTVGSQQMLLTNSVKGQGTGAAGGQHS